MRKIVFVLVSVFMLISCKKQEKTETQQEKESRVVWQPYDEAADLAATEMLEQTRMHLKLINSKALDKNDIWKTLEPELDFFSEEKYDDLKKYILEKDIPTIQQQIKDGKLTYEELTLFYIYRIRKYESDNALSLNSVISLNPKVVEQARNLDKIDKKNIDVNSIFGMPILLKDNIGTKDMVTTAGAVAFQNNNGKSAFITERLLNKNALILGKANLSEWAYFLCSGCPVGYSAIGGQTLNPYGRMVFETGGSSSGSGVAVAANFCVAAIGTETSGSILSPSSQNSVVGLKPTIGVLSRTGIVPISSTLDTPGPMTKSVIDNAIVLNAITGKDDNDVASRAVDINFVNSIKESSLKEKRFGVIKEFLEDSIYKIAIEKIKKAGGEIIEIEPKQVQLPGFLSILNIDMKNDLPAYISTQAGSDVTIKNIKDAIVFNQQDSINRIPYGQQLFKGILNDSTTTEELDNIKENLKMVARNYFDTHIDTHQLDAVLSINNYHAGYAAVAKYPALTVPMGYTSKGEPKGLTFIAKPFSEASLLQLGGAYEQATKERKEPTNYVD
ncbi:amidase [Aquimarina sp. EL_43]|uniref:amidase family protein n=1 Tax=unclassified Aquimarina TaxID=2627091 RepID=UPI0018C9B75A|nr:MULTISPECIES: amidase family protein [unclassified Aquimarina]MBG6132406.1 amidase [Aquimarina sp. EL_35]MBG6152537.1 amidase [Aquimarina sp. EL_32]MBG6170536.1 amidase [Aquimarina sp. EL_43]